MWLPERSISDEDAPRLELERPAPLKDGTFPISLLDDKVRRNLRMLIASGALDGRRPGTINTKAHQEVARRVAQEGIVLLKNQPS